MDMKNSFVTTIDMRNPHNAATDALVVRQLDRVLQDITNQDPENPDRWIVRLEVKPGFDSHRLHGAIFEVIAVYRQSLSVNVLEHATAHLCAQEYAVALFHALTNPPGVAAANDGENR